MNIPVNEQETVINFTRDSDKATIYTTDTTMRSKLHNLSMKNGKDWVLLRQDTDSIDHDIISETYQCPKKLISLRVLSRKLTEEQRQAAAERQVIVTWYKPEEKLPTEDEYVVITFSGRRNINESYIHALGIGVYYQGDGWLIDGMDEIESDFMTIEAWADLDSYGMGEEK